VSFFGASPGLQNKVVCYKHKTICCINESFSNREERMTQVYQYRLIVTPEAVDVNNHVNNIEYLKWMQTAALLHSEMQGCTKATLEVGATWVVRSHFIEYLRPAFSGDNIIVLTWVSNIRRVKSLRKYRIVRPKDNTTLVEGKTDWVFIDAQTGRLRSIPENVIASFEILPPEKEDEILRHLPYA